MIVNLRAVAGVLGALLAALGGVLLVPAGVAAVFGERAAAWAFAGTGVAALGLGTAVWVLLRPRAEDDLRVREAFAVVALAWALLSLVGAVPVALAAGLAYTDAVFETVSGFTTTGASVLGGGGNPPVEAVGRGVLLWRSLAQWLGGMGIIVLGLAVLPILGVGGMQLFRAEVAGPAVDKLTPRVRQTAARLWGIYVGLTGLLALLLLPVLGPFDALNHALTTMATGGFSTRTESVAAFGSAYVETVLTLFMVLAGMNFALHAAVLRRGDLGAVWRSEEFRVYAGLLVLATAALALALWVPAAATLPEEVGLGEPIRFAALGDALRHAAFQAASILTTTGFAASDYERWPALGMGVVFLLFFIGGMAGSTAGGVKVVRVVLLLKNALREVQRLLHPQAVLPLRLDHRVVPPEVLRNVLSFAVLYIGLVFAGTGALAFLGVDLLTAFGASLSCAGNVGPGFGTVGPAETYAHLPAAGKWVLAALMLAGRLEIFTVLVLFVPGFWRR